VAGRIPCAARGFGLASTLRVGRWLARWARHDPRQAHAHLGPVGVETVDEVVVLDARDDLTWRQTPRRGPAG